MVLGSILHGVDPLSYFSFQPELHDWNNNMMVHIKDPLVLIEDVMAATGFLSRYLSFNTPEEVCIIQKTR